MKALLFLITLFAVPAFADFTFDPTGAGQGSSVVGLAADPGSALAKGGVTAIKAFQSGNGSTAFTVTYQAGLKSGGKVFTIAATVPEVITRSQFSNVGFAIDADGQSTFTMSAGGTSILTGHVTNVVGGFSSFGSAKAKFDSSPNGNQWGSQMSAMGVGYSALTVMVDSVDAKYFPGMEVGSSLVVNGSIISPFYDVDPAKMGGSLGAVNGVSGPDFQFQLWTVMSQ